MGLDSSPKHRLTPVFRKVGGRKVHTGWNKKINRKPQWICSSAVAPTGQAADEFYEKNFTQLWNPPEPTVAAAIDVATLADHFIDRKRRAGIDPRSLSEYRDAAQDFSDIIGDKVSPIDLTPADFARVRAAWDKRFGPDRLSKFVVMIRGMFKWARKPPLRLPEPDYGDEFNTPRRLAVKRHRAADRQKHGLKLFEASEIRKLMAAANPIAKAMVLLALNGGLGNTDIAELPLAVVDVRNGWIDYARGKTGNERRFPLWPETESAIKRALAVRAKRFDQWLKNERNVSDVAHLLFVTRQARPYILDTTSKAGRPLHKDRVATGFAKLCDAAGLIQFRRGFYSLRRTFRTFADETGDQRAAALIMGHDLGDIGGVYVQRISDERIKAITDHVRSRLLISARSTEARPAVRKQKRAAGAAKSNAKRKRDRRA